MHHALPSDCPIHACNSKTRNVQNTVVRHSVFWQPTYWAIDFANSSLHLIFCCATIHVTRQRVCHRLNKHSITVIEDLTEIWISVGSKVVRNSHWLHCANNSNSNSKSNVRQGRYNCPIGLDRWLGPSAIPSWVLLRLMGESVRLFINLSRSLTFAWSISAGCKYDFPQNSNYRYQLRKVTVVCKHETKPPEKRQIGNIKNRTIKPSSLALCWTLAFIGVIRLLWSFQYLHQQFLPTECWSQTRRHEYKLFKRYSADIWPSFFCGMFLMCGMNCQTMLILVPYKC